MGSRYFLAHFTIVRRIQLIFKFIPAALFFAFISTSHAADVSIEQQLSSHYLDLNQAQSLQISVTSTDINTAYTQQLQIQFSNPVSLSNIPANCSEDANNNRLDCSVEIPALAQNTITLSPTFSIANSGLTTIQTTRLASAQITDENADNDQSKLLVFSGTVVRQPIDNRLAGADAILSSDVNSDNADDLMVARGLNILSYINSGSGVFTAPSDNRYVGTVGTSSAHDRITSMLELNNDGDSTSPEIFISTNSNVSFLLEQHTRASPTPTNDPFLVIPAGVEYYAAPAQSNIYANPESAVPRVRIAVDLDADISTQSNYRPGKEVVTVTVPNARQQITTVRYQGSNNPTYQTYRYGRHERTDVTTGDLDGDSKLDIIYSGADKGRIFFSGSRYNDDLVYRYRVALRVYINQPADHVAVMDIDQDTDLDIIYAVNNGAQKLGQLKLYLNNGTGGFSLSETTVATAVVDEMSVVDINNDNTPELIVAQNGGITIYQSSNELLTLYPVTAIINPPFQFADFDQDQIQDIAGDRIILSNQLVNTPPENVPPENQPPENVQSTFSIGGGGALTGLALLSLVAGLIISRRVRSRRQTR